MGTASEHSIRLAGLRVIVVMVVLLPLLHASILFAASSTWYWTHAWGYFILFSAGMLIQTTAIAWRNPAVLNARGEPHQGSETWDRPLLRMHVALMIANLAVAGLDHRWSWSSLPWPLPILGVALLGFGFVFAGWALAVNPHFEPTVRHQTDRDHRVIDVGPYRFVRHPGYVGTIAVFVALPLLLDSYWAFIPAFLDTVVFVIRTYKEDAMLSQKLTGYADYTRRVTGRLIPGIW